MPAYPELPVDSIVLEPPPTEPTDVPDTRMVAAEEYGIRPDDHQAGEQ